MIAPSSNAKGQKANLFLFQEHNWPSEQIRFKDCDRPGGGIRRHRGRFPNFDSILDSWNWNMYWRRQHSTNRFLAMSSGLTDPLAEKETPTVLDRASTWFPGALPRNVKFFYHSLWFRLTHTYWSRRKCDATFHSTKAQRRKSDCMSAFESCQRTYEKTRKNLSAILIMMLHRLPCKDTHPNHP